MLFNVATLVLALAPLTNAAACPVRYTHTQFSTFSPSSQTTTETSATTLSIPTQGTNSTSSVTPTSVSASSVPTSTESVESGSSGVTPNNGTAKYIGLGTRYGLSDGCTEENCWQRGACSFVDYRLPEGVDGSTCVSEDIWENGGHCGGCIAVTYKGKTLRIMVTNLTGGKATHLDMTPSTWSKLTNAYSGGGVDGIEWEWVACPTDKAPLAIHMHVGSSRFWFAATVENATLRTSKIEVSCDNGQSWQATTREKYNMYVLKGALPKDTVWVRATSVSGEQVVVEDVVLKSGQVTQGKTNYRVA